MKLLKLLPLLAINLGSLNSVYAGEAYEKCAKETVDKFVAEASFTEPIKACLENFRVRFINSSKVNSDNSDYDARTQIMNGSFESNKGSLFSCLRNSEVGAVDIEKVNDLLQKMRGDFNSLDENIGCSDDL